MNAGSLYFVNRWVDTLVIGGLSIVTRIALLAFYHSADTQPIYWFALILSLLVNYPHFSATVYRLYRSPDNVRRYPVTAVGLPLILFGAVGASFWQPNVIAPYFLMLFLLWSPYHYSGQTIGLTMVYARRARLSDRSAGAHGAVGLRLFGLCLRNNPFSAEWIKRRAYRIPTACPFQPFRFPTGWMQRRRP